MRKIALIFVILLLFGCESVECLSVDNKKALDLILKNLNKDITHTYGCFFDRYDMNIYGLNKTNDINTFLNNIENVKKLDNINMKIIAYKEKEEFKCREYSNGVKSCRVKLKGEPIFKIKINNIGKYYAKQ